MVSSDDFVEWMRWLMVGSDDFVEWMRWRWIDCYDFYKMDEVVEMVGCYVFMKWMR